MSHPPRLSPSMRQPSAPNLPLNNPVVLPQYPPIPYPSPHNRPHPMHPGDLHRGPSFGNMNGNGDSHRYFRMPSRPEEVNHNNNNNQNHSQSPETMMVEPRSQQKKRPRQSSTSQNDKTSPPSPKPEGQGPPSVLVREKKQKACANCRRAKLKCIVDANESDCVRCKARKERCIFYPRSHDEDWQQTLTTDVYAAINHLSHLSSAVHHVLHHLTIRQIIPPYAPGLMMYDAPNRDMAILQGWGAEKGRDGNGDEGKKRGKRRNRDQSDDDDEADDELPSTGSTIPFPPPTRTQSLSDQPWPGMQIPPLPHPHPHPILSHRFSEPQLPAFRPPQHPVPVQLTPTSELDIPVPQAFYQPMVMSMPPPTLPPQQQNLSPIITPGSMQQATPTSLIHSSPALDTDPASFSVMTIPQSLPDQEVNHSLAVIAEGRNEEILGEDDARPSIISKGLVTAHDARLLVDHFHDHLSPSLFGYHLEFRHFPYLPDGPRTMTPFILAVLCVVSSERLSNRYSQLLPALGKEVAHLLITSPAGSWQDFATSTSSVTDDGEDALDPELGIGPEEIVGACILATFWGDQPSHGGVIANNAFRWARGWIKLLKGPARSTIAESIGFVPAERKANEDDMARVWLLCYIVDGTYAIQWDSSPPQNRDPLRWCQLLVPTSTSPSHSPTTTHISPHDIILTFHARLIKILHDWQIHRHSFPSLSTLEHKRLAASANASLDLWKDELNGHSLDRWWTREVELFWLYAKVTVNAAAAKALGLLEGGSAGGGREIGVRNASRAMMVEAGMGLLERCAEWNPRECLVNLPNCYFNMMNLAAVEVTDAIKDTLTMGMQGTGCSVSSHDVLPLLRDVRDTLYLGKMDKSHLSTVTAASLGQCCQELEVLG